MAADDGKAERFGGMPGPVGVLERGSGDQGHVGLAFGDDLVFVPGFDLKIHDVPVDVDDASGTAVVLELARVLSQVELKADVYHCCVTGGRIKPPLTNTLFTTKSCLDKKPDKIPQEKTHTH